MPSSVAVVSRSYSSSERRSVVGRASDWAGFIVFAALAVWTLRRMPAIGIFLLPTIAHELFMATAFLIRDRAKAADRHAAAQLAAYGGTFLVFGFFHAARTWWPELLTQAGYPMAATLGAVVWLAGSLLAPFSVWTLRYSFSIEPQARRMVRRGPYAYVRHPIYLSYLFQYGGLLLIYPTELFAIVLLLWIGLTLTRIRYEEHVLASAFPEYEEYRRTTGALLPIRFGKVAAVRSDTSKVATV